NVLNIPPEKVTAVKCPTVCLEYGKRDPNANVAYEIVPIESVTDREDVKILVGMLHQLDYKSAQFAAWHLASGTSVQHLATETVLRPNGVRITNFTPQQVQRGLQLIQYARQTAAQRALESSAPSSSSESSTH
ncbi:MAG: hypothetical protein Q4D38_06575, partial [Planctomycetia bacterium]|nr:hypothetical protein [Planctomycetia bacterium]